MLTMKHETFEGTFPFPPQYQVVNGFAMHFVDEGSGEPVVMLHGDPTWGYLSIGTLSPPFLTSTAVSYPIIWAWGNQRSPKTPRSTA